jgi:hypothetical protein
MGRISKKLSKMIRSSRKPKVIRLRDYAKEKQLLDDSKNDVREVKELVENGYDPLHAVYLSAQNLVSVLSEFLSDLPLFKDYYDKADYAEDEYLPGGPPMSPLTSSYFTTWAFFDLQFGGDHETIGTCILEASNELNLYSWPIIIINITPFF